MYEKSSRGRRRIEACHDLPFMLYQRVAFSRRDVEGLTIVAAVCFALVSGCGTELPFFGGLCDMLLSIRLAFRSRK